MKRLIVIGAGAIGGCIGGLLCHASKSVVLVARGQHGDSIRSNGLSVKFPNRIVRSNPMCQSEIGQIDWSDGDVAMIATKLNDAETIMDSLKAVAGSSIPIVCASNGVHGERWAAERFETVVSMLIWMPSVHLHPGDVRVYGQGCPGVLEVGPVQGYSAIDYANTLSRWLGEVGFDSVCRHDIEAWKNAKWVTNLGNAAQALVVDDWKSVAKAAQAEGEQVLDAAGIQRVPTPELLARAKHIELAPIDGERRPGGSTWQSLQRGKALETPWIEGAMVELGKKSGVDTPVLHALVTAAKTSRKVSAAEVLPE